ncbi:MAG: FtsX-like permease family protein [Gemmatimonadetes bacterium]|nr:FtsX-like permease family protein [Gemmatimonadota bacterium]MBT7858776.1 FtsX-like permease family protein [Gemmatimonadota bacterium]
MSWVLRTAWRDSRGRRRRLFLYTGAIAVGIAALTSLRGLGRTMAVSVDQQAQTLLGADMEIESNLPFDDEVETVLDSIGGDQSHQVEFNSMVLLPRVGGARLSQVRAQEGDYPYYGELRTIPAAAADNWQSAGGALVDESLLLQYGAEVGDSIKVGNAIFAIHGRLLNVPGETSLRSDVQPRVFIPMRYLQQTGLVKRGSRVEYRRFLRFDAGTDVPALARQLQQRFEGHNVDVDTVEDRKRRLGRTLGNLYRFLGLGSFVALLLGAVGVASAIHAHVEQKLETVAILRSLGATSGQALRIYLVQAGAMGLVGSMLGAIAGSAFLLLLPGLLSDFLPAELSDVEIQWSIRPFFEAAGIGSAIALLFAALPLLAVRRASPLLALRASYEDTTPSTDRGWRILLIGLCIVSTYLLALWLAGRPDHALYFAGGTLVAFLLLALAAHLLRGAIRRWFPTSWSFVWRQGLANLYRPHNQTLLLLVSLGLGTFLVTTLYSAQSSIIAHIEGVSGGDQPNVVLFDIQTDQADDVAALVDSLGMPLLQQVPIVTMHIASVKGVPVSELSSSGQGRRGRWAFEREYRSTYRGELTSSETIVEGAWRAVTTDTVFVSVETGMAHALGVAVGDSITFDVQGVPIGAVVGSLRDVEWQRIMPNFMCVFATGVLEGAPQFHVLVTRGQDSAIRAELQRRAVTRFPNLSIIDLDLVLRSVDNILSKVAVVVRIMAFFSVFTGLIVLVAVVSSSYFQRLRESALMRTLGASRAKVSRILIVEYLLLGSLAALTGLGLSILGGWAVTRYVFEITFAAPWWSLAAVAAIVPAATVVVGAFGSRGIHSAPPLEVLRTAD